MIKTAKPNMADSYGSSFEWVTGKLSHKSLATKPKGAQYDGEEKKVGFRAVAYRGGLLDKESDEIQTIYTPAEEQKSAILSPSGRIMEDEETPYDTRTHTSANTTGFVMSGSGGLHLFDPYGAKVVRADDSESPYVADYLHPLTTLRLGAKQVRVPHHTTPLAGDPVAGAGGAEIIDGYLAAINDHSGHYAPEAEYTYQTIAALKEQGVAMDRPAEADEMKGTRSMRVTLCEKDNADTKTRSSDLTLPYQAFLTSYGNEGQIRLKETLNSEICAAQGKVPRKIRGGKTRNTLYDAPDEEVERTPKSQKHERPPKSQEHEDEVVDDEMGLGDPSEPWRIVLSDSPSFPFDVAVDSKYNFKVGNCVVIKGTRAFKRAILSQLGLSATRPSQLMNLRYIHGGDHTMTIISAGKNSGCKPLDSSGDCSSRARQDATREGCPVFRGKDRVIENGKPLVGTGKGTDCCVLINLRESTINPLDPDNPVPRDAILFHEMNHGVHAMKGEMDPTPLPDDPKWTNQEEKNTITQVKPCENDYLAECKYPYDRVSHTGSFERRPV
jgi:hypothetical protein